MLFSSLGFLIFTKYIVMAAMMAVVIAAAMT
jgi:hypothetical protein